METFPPTFFAAAFEVDSPTTRNPSHFFSPLPVIPIHIFLPSNTLVPSFKLFFARFQIQYSCMLKTPFQSPSDAHGIPPPPFFTPYETSITIFFFKNPFFFFSRSLPSFIFSLRPGPFFPSPFDGLQRNSSLAVLILHFSFTLKFVFQVSTYSIPFFCPPHIGRVTPRKMIRPSL